MPLTTEEKYFPRVPLAKGFSWEAGASAGTVNLKQVKNKFFAGMIQCAAFSCWIYYPDKDGNSVREHILSAKNEECLVTAMRELAGKVGALPVTLPEETVK